MFKTFNEITEFLLRKLPNFSNKTYPIQEFKLDKINAFAATLNHPEKKIKTIHVAGTNGKGSVSNMLAAVFCKNNYKTGLFTSPHLYSLTERIKIDGKDVDKNFVIDFINTHITLIEKLQLSFFEIMTMLGFEYFYQNKVDIAIIEVGMGGRLDSTNIITPLLSIITNISFDHMQWLGNSLEEIAMEKAGIIKPQVQVVVGERNPQTAGVFEKIAQQQKSDLWFASDHKFLIEFVQKKDSVEITYIDKHKKKLVFELDLMGQYQVHNLFTVLQCLEILSNQGWSIDEETTKQALSQVKNINHFKGRWDVLCHSPLLIADVAHNEGGIKFIKKFLQEKSFENIHIVIGRLKDKNQDDVLSLLPTHAKYYFTQASVFRSLTATELQSLARKHNLLGECYTNVNDAVQSAVHHAQNNDVILICGSIFLYADIDLNAIKF